MSELVEEEDLDAIIAHSPRAPTTVDVPNGTKTKPPRPPEDLTPEATTEPTTWKAVATVEEAFQPLQIWNEALEDDSTKEKDTEQLVREIHDPLGIYGQKEVAALINVWVKTNTAAQNASLAASMTPKLSVAVSLLPSLSSSNVHTTVETSRDLSSKFNALSENFDPKLFLEVVHKNTPKNDLRKGLDHAKKLFGLQTEQLKSLVELNFERFISCKDTIDDIHQQIKINELSDEGAGTAKVDLAFQTIVKQAESIYGTMLKRKQEAEKLRNFLGILKRFQFVIHLPSTIRESIQKGEYDKVVRDYKRASSLSSHTNVKIFQKVANEAQVIIEDFTKQLLKSLEDPTLFREEHDRIISLLIELGSKTDPTLHYLVHQTKWICALLDEKSEQYYNPIVSKKRAVSSTLNNAQSSSAPSSVTSNKLKLLTEEAINNKHKVIHKLSLVMTLNLPDLWQLAKTLLPPEQQPSSSSASISSATASGVLTSGQLVPGGVKMQQLQKSSEVTRLIKDISALYSEKIRMVLFDQTRDELAQPISKLASNLSLQVKALKKCFHEVFRCYSSLTALSISSDMISPLTRLVNEIKSFYVDGICKQTQQEVERFQLASNWVFYRSTVSSSAGIPTQFFEIIKNTIKELEEIIINNQPLIAEVYRSIVETTYVFLDLLHSMAFDVDQGNNVEENTSEVFASEKKLLLPLNNCNYMRREIIPELFRLFEKRLSYSNPSTQQSVVCVMTQLEGMILDRYVRNKVLRNNYIVERAIELTKLQHSQPPKEIRPYVMELLLQLVYVHAELSKSGNEHLQVILSRLLEGILQSYFDFIKAIQCYSYYSWLQLEAELAFIVTILGKFKTKVADGMIETLVDSLSKLYDNVKDFSEIESQKKQLQVIARTQVQKTKMLFVCFN